MTRLERRNRTGIVFKGCGGFYDLFDDAIKEAWRINDDEYDYLCEFGSDEVLKAMVSEPKSYSEAKQHLTLVNECLINYVKQHHE